MLGRGQKGELSRAQKRLLALFTTYRDVGSKALARLIGPQGRGPIEIPIRARDGSLL